MPRVSIRRVFMYLLAIATVVLVSLNVHQTLMGHNAWPALSGAGVSSSGPGGTGSRLVAMWARQGRGANAVEVKTDILLGHEGTVSGIIKQDHSEPVNTSEALTLQIKPWHSGRKLDLSPLDPSDISIPEPHERPWFMSGGKVQPTQCVIDPVTQKRAATILPEDANTSNDRILDQLMFYPPNGYIPENLQDTSIPLKKILLWNGISSWGGTRPGRGVFLKQECPVNSCAITTSRTDSLNADLVLFKDHFTMPTYQRPLNQLWMMYMLECPLHTQMFKSKDVFNWTSTYRSDSTIVAPYERWLYHNENVRAQVQPKNYAANKTKTVAWFVSNCGARNGRLDYAKQLQKYIQVDIYGSCGSKRCPRSQSKNCFEMLNKQYKFYLAFENSNCQDYITEKFFVNGLGHDILPIVMGARPQDYQRSSPEHSFIHVDDFDGPEKLAEYLHKLDQNDDLYNEYFQWKGTGEFINTKFFCRVCAMLHDPKIVDHQAEQPYYKDINEWWRGPGTCINGSWRKFYEALERDAQSKRQESQKQRKIQQADKEKQKERAPLLAEEVPQIVEAQVLETKLDQENRAQ